MRCLAHAAGRLLPGRLVPCCRCLLHSLSRPAAAPTPRQATRDRQPSSWGLGRRDAASLRTSVTGDPGIQGAPLKEDDDRPDTADDGEVAGPGPGSQSLGFGAPQRPLDPGLYVIPTPIGNLGDITYRAADTLRRVGLLLAEDTRHTRKLLNHLGVRHVELLSCHEHNEKLRLGRVLQRLQGGEAVGLVSDAGMPGISDPGHQVIAAALAAGVPVHPLPGPCAAVTALVGSGLPTERFLFVGFLPPKSGARRKELQALAGQPATLVLYAPPHGLGAVLRDCAEVLGGGRRCCVARELSKLHEEYYRGTLGEATREFTEVREARGEICLVVEGCGGGPAGGGAGGGGDAAAAGDPEVVERVLRELLAEGTSVSSAVKEVVANLGANRKAAYQLALRLSQETGRKPNV